MKVMRYINLFYKISKITPKHCFMYNSTIIFVVPQSSISKAIGDNGKNIKEISDILNRKVKVVGVPKGIEDAEKFVSTIIYPTQIKSVELRGDNLIINAGQQSKAMLIGRNKIRLEEMRKIIKDYFGKKLEIA